MVDVNFQENYGSFLPIGLIALGTFLLMSLVMVIRIPHEERRGMRSYSMPLSVLGVGIAAAIVSSPFGMSTYPMSAETETTIAKAVGEKEKLSYVGMDNASVGLVYYYVEPKTQKMSACKFDVSGLRADTKLSMGPQGPKTFQIPYSCQHQ